MKPTINKITKECIKKNDPCTGALEWYGAYLGKSPLTILNKLIKHKKYDWANWVIVRVMEYKDYVSYAVFAAEQVIDIFEKKYPNDKRPRQAIEAAKRCIDNPSQKNKATAEDAAEASARAARASATSAAWAAAWVARAAEEAARVAEDAAEDAEDAAWAARAATGAAARAAARPARPAEEAIQLKILKYGIELLKGVE